MSDAVVEARGLRKSYGAFEALKGIDLTVRKGEVFCLLGPNGAGKTTTIEILEGHRNRDSGDVSVLGYDPSRDQRALRQCIGIVLQSAAVERFLTVDEVVELFRGYYPHPHPLDETLRLVGLEDKRKSLVRRLSGGQVRRLDMALALAGDPDLLFLDEPTAGFDPAARRGAWEVIQRLQALGKTILLTTHNMEEAERLADHLAILVAGEIVKEGSVADLRREHADTTISFLLPQIPLPDRLQSICRLHDGRISMETQEPTRSLHELTTWASETGIELDDLRVAPISLEEIYLRLAGAEALETRE